MGDLKNRTTFILKVVLALIVVAVVGGLIYYVPRVGNTKNVSVEKKTQLEYMHKYEATVHEGRIKLVQEIKTTSNVNTYKPELAIELEEKSGDGTPTVYLFDRKELDNLKIKDSTNKISSYKDLAVDLHVKIRKIKDSYEISVLK